MVTIKFYLRKSSLGGDYEGRICIRLIYRRKITTITTPFKVLPYEWDEQNGTLRENNQDQGRKKELTKIQQLLEEEKKIISQIEQRLLCEGKLSIDTISRAYKERNSLTSWKRVTNHLSSELYAAGQTRTAEAYHSSLSRLLGFVGKRDLSLDRLDAILIRRFEQRLREEGKSLNTISFYMRNLRAIFNKAIKKGLVTIPEISPFAGVFTGVQVTRKRAIPREEMARLNRLFQEDSSSLSYAQKDALGLFMFSFHARGMSFIDIAHLKKENIRDGRIFYTRRKTGKPMEVELNGELKKLIRYFEKRMKDSPFLLPVIKDPGLDSRKQYLKALRLQNKRLKRVTRRSAKDLSLSTHMARHSWATIAKGENISLRVISECLGHTSEKTTLIYLASFERSVLDEANRKVIRALKKIE